MHRPQKKTVGGDYITSTQPDSSISTSNITTSSIQYITSSANLSSFTDVANLSIDQISSVIRYVDKQIIYDEEQILANNNRITELNLSINTPGGLQDQYNTAENNYNSTFASYTTISTNLAQNQAQLLAAEQNYSSLSTSTINLTSTISSLAWQYSSLLLELGTSNSLLVEYESTFQGKMVEYQHYKEAYDAAVSDMNETISSLEFNSSILSTATHDYNSTNDMYTQLFNDYIAYSTGTYASSVNAAISTRSYYSSLVKREQEQLSTLVSTSTALNFAEIGLKLAIVANNCNSTLSSELSTISTLDYTNLSLSTLKAQLSMTPMDTTLLDQQIALQTMASALSTQLANTQASLSACKSQQSSLQIEDYQMRLLIADDNILAARNLYVKAQLDEMNVLSTISSLSSLVAYSYIAESTLQSSIKGYSTIYYNEQLLYNKLSSQVYAYDLSDNILSTQLISVFSAINKYRGISSLYVSDILNYQSTYTYYSTLEFNTISSISGYNGERSRLIEEISTVNYQINTIITNANTEFGNIDTNAASFFTYKQNEMVAEVEEYEYSAREYNAAVGLAIADLFLLKGNNLSILDRLYLEIQQATAEAQIPLITIQQGIVGQNSNIDGYISILNPLEIQFNNLIKLVLDEKQMKIDFITIRQQLYAIERSSLQYGTITTQSLKTSYVNAFADLNAKVQSINSKMFQRDQLLASINTSVNSIKANIASILNGDRFPTSLTSINYDTVPIAQQSTDPNAPLSEYALIQPIDFNTMTPGFVANFFS